MAGASCNQPGPSPRPGTSSSGGGRHRSLDDYQYVTEPNDALKCLICLEVAQNPRQHEGCGKLFCNKCIKKYGKQKPCPNCKKTGGQFYKDYKSE